MGAAGVGLRCLVMAVGLCVMTGTAVGIRFVIDREECFSHDVKYEGDTFHFSFVVVKADAPWQYGGDEGGVDLLDSDAYKSIVWGRNWRRNPGGPWIGTLVKGPDGEHIHETRGKASEKFEFVIQKRGLYRFCFTNRSPYHETIDFDVHVGHFAYSDSHAKDEHLNPLLEQIGKLEEALYNIQFEQHWLEAQTDRQAIINEGMSQRAIHKAIFESLALIGSSVLQVYLLRRLFERKLATSRV